MDNTFEESRVDRRKDSSSTRRKTADGGAQIARLWGDDAGVGEASGTMITMPMIMRPHPELLESIEFLSECLRRASLFEELCLPLQRALAKSTFLLQSAQDFALMCLFRHLRLHIAGIST